jgi:riboflavin kinase / FMN adenylyltransferase
MKIYHGIEDFARLECAVVTSGTFDGVHVGHQKILQRLQETAEKMGGETVVITFWPHPRLVLNPLDTHLKLLSTFEEKAERLRTYGVQHLLRIPFTKEFSQLSSGEFIRNILVDAIGTSKLVIGYDHHVGKNREGSFEQLKENGPQYGFEPDGLSWETV